MHFSKYNVLLGLLIIIGFTSLMGSHFGYTVNGVPQAGAVISTTSPGLLGVVDFVWDSIVFLFNMVTFRVDGMPVFLSTIFDVMAIMVVFLIVSLIRGN